MNRTKLQRGRRLSAVVAIGILIALTTCKVYEYDTEDPTVNLIAPPDQAVIGDQMTLEVDAVDNEGISHVEFFIDQRSVGTDSMAPYQLEWTVPDSGEPGMSFYLLAKAFDLEENEFISNAKRVYFQWRQIGVDKNEAFSPDIERMYARSTGDELQFRIKDFDDWDEPYDSTRGLITAVFLDVDGDSTTGLSPDTSAHYHGRSVVFQADSQRYSVGNIGADYAIVTGVEGDSIWSWNSTELRWDPTAPLNHLMLEPDTNVVEFGVGRSHLENPAQIAVVGLQVVLARDTVYWDWIPEDGHSTYEVNGLYLGE